jgi:restriction endonuclease Mrr
LGAVIVLNATSLASKDGGVDAVATSKHLFFGGVCLIQAKRWTGLVGLESVHAVTGVMADHNATTGVLVTTPSFRTALIEESAVANCLLTVTRFRSSMAQVPCRPQMLDPLSWRIFRYMVENSPG